MPKQREHNPCRTARCHNTQNGSSACGHDPANGDTEHQPDRNLRNRTIVYKFI